jgi:hypothetical protein
MGDKLGDRDTTKKQQPPPPPQQQISSPPKDPLEESTETRQQQQQRHHSPPNVAPFYVPSEQQFEAVNPKRPRYTGQWKLLPSPTTTQQKQQTQLAESSPTNPQTQQSHTAAASSTDTASTPSHSPLPSLSAASGQDTNKPEGEHAHHQIRKGKYVSPVWKPNEMLWLARAWRIQHQGGSDGSGSSSRADQLEGGQTRGKTRADKDREVADFLQTHGVNRDAKTAGTKWDNMLGEFRKVYEWERGGEREQVGKSYFRLSPYERKLHRLPASFDEEVFEELSQFMGSKMRTSQSRGSSGIVAGDDSRAARALPPPAPFREDDQFPLSGLHLKRFQERRFIFFSLSFGNKFSFFVLYLMQLGQNNWL